jgi:DNA topoisomerase-3
MTSVAGHLMETDFLPEFRQWSSCPPVDLFSATIRKEVKSENENMRRTLDEEARKHNVLLLWLDCDMEGEAIAFEVMEVCLKANPRLDVYRARFSALIERDIMRAMQMPDRPNKNLNDAVEARQEIDLRIGSAFTRFQTIRLQKRFDSLGKSVISYGPCQFPTLGFVVQRHEDIQKFVAQTFWYLSCDAEFEHPDDPSKRLSLSFTWDRSRLYDQHACFILFDICMEGTEATVVKCQERPTSKRKPIPLNTIDFQILASKSLRMSSERAMTVAESLYQRGILSYPRTETNFFKEGFELHTLIADHRGHSQWGNFAHRLLDDNLFEWPKAGGKDDQAHPPIHPTKCVELASLGNDEERNIYEMVTRHFLACCSKDARGSQTNISICIPENGGETFSATGLMVLERNYLDVYSKFDYWNGMKVPLLQVGDKFVPKSLLMKEGQTCPPDPISESDLISAMDKNGIGTDATIATHIATIQTREYVTKDASNRFVPTPLGLALVEGYNTMGYQLNKPQLRAAIEADCQRVARGELSKVEAVNRCLATMRACFITCQREAEKLDRSVERYFATKGKGDPTKYNVVARDFTVCGGCRNRMDLREDKAGENQQRYLFCKTCSLALPMPSKGDLLPHEHFCPICSYQVVTVHNKETGKDHTLCPSCFNNPPPPPFGVEGAFDFRCFSCANEDCLLASRVAGANIDIAPCPERNCRGFMRIKKTGKGILMASCSGSNCKSVWWIPKFVKSASPLPDQNCQRCQQRLGVKVVLVQFKFIMSKAPLGIEPEKTICPCCDPLWAESGNPSLQTRGSIASMQSILGQNIASNNFGTGPSRDVPSNSLLIERESLHSRSAANVAVVPTSFGGNSSSGKETSSYDAALAGITMQVRTSAHSSSFQYSAQGFAASYPSSSSSTMPSVPMEISDPNCPLCDCQIPSKLFTVAKEGPNKGRPFYGCSKPRGESCKFFQWGDQPPSFKRSDNFATPSGPSSSSANGNYSNARPPLEDGPPCNCGEASVCLTTQKEGPNKGRKFYACRKRPGEGKCDFFLWQDNNGTGNRIQQNNENSSYGRYQTPQSASIPNSNSRAQYGSGGNSDPNVTCSRCRQIGHYARECSSR